MQTITYYNSILKKSYYILVLLSYIKYIFMKVQNLFSSFKSRPSQMPQRYPVDISSLPLPAHPFQPHAGFVLSLHTSLLSFLLASATAGKSLKQRKARRTQISRALPPARRVISCTPLPKERDGRISESLPSLALFPPSS